MPLAVPIVLQRIREGARRLQWSRWAAMGVGAGLVVLLFVVVQDPQRWIVAIPLLLFTFRAALLQRRAHGLIRHSKLEERFVEHAPSEDPLRRTLRHRSHLWQRSYLMQGLRTLLTRPLPSRITRAEKEAYLRERFGQSFQPLRPGRLHLDGLLLVAAAVLWGALLPLEGTLLALIIGAALFILGGANEVLQQNEQVRLRGDFDDLTAALSAWTLDNGLDITLRHQSQEPYAHSIEYYSPPWLVE